MKASVYFESLGQRAASQGLELRYARSLANVAIAPPFAWDAFCRGWWNQTTHSMRVKALKNGAAQAPRATGATTKETEA